MIPTDTYTLDGQDAVSRWHAAPFTPPEGVAWSISAYCFTEEDELLVVPAAGERWTLPGGAPRGSESPDQALTRIVADAAAAVVERSVYLGAEEIVVGPRKRYVMRYWARVSSGEVSALEPEAAMMKVAAAAERCAWAGLHAALAVNARFRPLKEFYPSLPRKRMASGALFFNARGEILIVKPLYRPDWLIPGGVTEEDESPRMGCARETREEIGLEVSIGRVLCVEYQARSGPKTESLQWVFDGGILSETQISRIRLLDGELGEFRFAGREEALQLLNRSLGRRVAHALAVRERGGDVYLEKAVG